MRKERAGPCFSLAKDCAYSLQLRPLRQINHRVSEVEFLRRFHNGRLQPELAIVEARFTLKSPTDPAAAKRRFPMGVAGCCLARMKRTLRVRAAVVDAL